MTREMTNTDFLNVSLDNDPIMNLPKKSERQLKRKCNFAVKKPIADALKEVATRADITESALITYLIDEASDPKYKITEKQIEKVKEKYGFRALGKRLIREEPSTVSTSIPASNIDLTKPEKKKSKKKDIER